MFGAFAGLIGNIFSQLFNQGGGMGSMFGGGQ